MLQKAKVLLLDGIGVLLILGAAAFGWVPGPGGIPLLLAGLGVLAINHTWARQLLEKIKAKSTDFLELLFERYPLVAWIFDGLSIGLMAVAMALVQTDSSAHQYMAYGLIFSALSLFLFNRNRARHFLKWVKRSKA